MAMAGAHGRWREAEGIGLVQPREAVTAARATSSPPVSRENLWISSEQCRAEGQETQVAAKGLDWL